jgi:hypothetical protein
MASGHGGFPHDAGAWRRHDRVEVRGASSLFRKVWRLLRFDLLDPKVTLS